MTEADRPGAREGISGTEPWFSVVIVNYNCAALIVRCLESLREHLRAVHEIVVVDNESRPEDLRILEGIDGIRLIRSGGNLGFGRANNLGAAEARATHLVLLNPDTIVDSDVLERLVEHLEENPEVGLAAPLLIQEDGTFQNSWNVPAGLGWEFARGHYLQRIWYRNNWQRYLRRLGRNQPWDVGMVVGACMVVRRDEFLAMGGFDPDFFMNGEDEDLCDRIRRSGKRVRILPWVALHHHEGATQRLDWSRYMFHRFDALRIVIGKRFHGWRRAVALALWWEAVAARIVLGYLFLRGSARTRVGGYLLAARVALGAAP